MPAHRASLFAAYAGRPAIVGIRPEHFSLDYPDKENSASIVAEAEIVEPLGSETLVHVTVAGTKVCTRLSPDPSLKTKARLVLKVDAAKMLLLDPVTDKVVS